jgi:hypothetical protein
MDISFLNETSKLQPIRHKISASLAPLPMSLLHPLEDIQEVSQFGKVFPSNPFYFKTLLINLITPI